jgi:RNA polymerase sigma-70 factor (ECF subfamily)
VPENEAAQRALLLKIVISKRAGLVEHAARILRNRQHAEDIVQDAIVKICENTCNDVQSPHSYLFRMVRNMAIDSMRQTIRERRVIGEEDEMCDVAAAGVCPLERLLESEALEAIADALHKSPRRTREVFLEHRVGGATQKMIAQRIGVSPTLVNFMIRDAEAICQEAIEIERPRPPRKKRGRRRGECATCNGDTVGACSTLSSAAAPSLPGARDPAPTAFR